MATLIASWGGPDSNVYVDLTEAGSIITCEIFDNDAWTTVNTLKQATALIEATRNIDSRQYIGGVYFFDQRLEFPRSVFQRWPWNRTQIASANFSITFQHMEEDVKRACCYQALFVIRNGGRNEHTENINAGIKMVRERTGPVEDQIQYSGRTLSRLHPDAKQILADWMDSRRVVRG